MKIGLISDTHGWVHPRVFELFEGVDRIVHAGDIGSEDVLVELKTIAPVDAVAGNVDAEFQDCPLSRWVEAGQFRILVTHIVGPESRPSSETLTKAVKGRAAAVAFGHSHKAADFILDGVRFINPGAACRPRFRDVPSVSILTAAKDGLFNETFVL